MSRQKFAATADDDRPWCSLVSSDTAAIILFAQSMTPWYFPPVWQFPVQSPRN